MSSAIGRAFVVVAILFVGLYSRSLALGSEGLPGRALGEFTLLVTNPGTQGYVAAGLIFYVVLLAVYHARTSARRPWAWLTEGLVIWTLLVGGMYLACYAAASQSTQAVVLFTGVFAVMLVRCLSGPRDATRQRLTFRLGVLGGYLGCVALATFWEGTREFHFTYLDNTRIAGPWRTPNIFGLIMATGVCTWVGLLIAALRFRCRPPWIIVISLPGIMTTWGLIMSYSRGAWLAAFCGLLFLGQEIWNHWGPEIRARMEAELHARHWADRVGNLASLAPSILVILGSCVVITILGGRHSDLPILRRVSSVLNRNDLSVKNRISTYEGTLQIIADNPVTGLEFQDVETWYNEYYKPANLLEGGAIKLNSFLLMGATMGLPALLGLWFIIGRFLFTGRSAAMNPSARKRKSEPTNGDAASGDHPDLMIADALLRMTCRACVVILVIGFCFNGGLFALATSLPFWVYCELGRQEPIQ